MSDEQSEQLLRLAERDGALEAALAEERECSRLMEAQLAAALETAKLVEGRLKSEAASWRAERAGFLAKVGSMETDRASAEQSLVRLRDRVRDKEEGERAAERSLHDVKLAKETAERRVEAAKAALARYDDRLLEMQRQRTELTVRADGLAKTLAARDAALERLTAQHSGVAEELAQLRGRYGSLAEELELATRRHAEELQAERSERALAQSALEIARASRAALQKQHDAFRRAGAGWRDAPGDDDAPSPADAGFVDNIHPLHRVN